jgi:hypothetical protein
LWTNCSDSEKKKYNEMAAKDKERYQREMENSGSNNNLKDGKKDNKKRKQSVAKNESKIFYLIIRN